MLRQNISSISAKTARRALVFLFLAALAVPSQAGLFSWLSDRLPEQPKPEDPHLYPEGSMLYDVWTCKGESEIGWVGVTQAFTDRDPAVVVVVRTEFDESLGLDKQIIVELIAPKHNRIVASDRIQLRRNQDVAMFYHPKDLARKGGWGKYHVVLNLDGIPTDEYTFELIQVEELRKRQAEEARRKTAEEEFKAEFLGETEAGPLEAASLLGEPDVPSKSSLAELVEKPTAADPVMEVWSPEEWYRTDFKEDELEGRIIVFPKKARKTWQENSRSDLRHRIKYYIFL